MAQARGRLLVNAVLAVVVLVGAAVMVVRLGGHAEARPTAVPRSAAMERLTGVRFSRVAVVGDGGLVTVFYVVLDAEKATRFQADREDVPVLRSEARHASTRKASIMRSGHLVRPGQTYYFVYQNSARALRPTEKMTLTYDGVSLRHVPVL